MAAIGRAARRAAERAAERKAAGRGPWLERERALEFVRCCIGEFKAGGQGCLGILDRCFHCEAELEEAVIWAPGEGFAFCLPTVHAPPEFSRTVILYRSCVGCNLNALARGAGDVTLDGSHALAAEVWEMVKAGVAKPLPGALA